MEIIRYILKYKVYILINIIILIIGYWFVDKGIRLYKPDQINSSIYISVGTSLIATGIVLFLDIWKNLTIDNIKNKIDNIINNAGIEEVSKKRDIDRYDGLMDNLKDSLDICGYSIGAFFDSFSEILKFKCDSKNVKARILLVNPDSNASSQRAELEGKSVELFRQKVNAVKTFYHTSTNIEIRKIDVPLSSMIFRIDDIMFIGPHFYKKQSKTTLTFELSKNKWLFKEYQDEFNRMWTDATPI